MIWIAYSSVVFMFIFGLVIQVSGLNNTISLAGSVCCYGAVNMILITNVIALQRRQIRELRQRLDDLTLPERPAAQDP